MSNAIILTMLKTDLQITVNGYDLYLENLIELARAAIKREGIDVDDSSVEDCMLISMYAAYLYRKRREENSGMPRSLRYTLNNRLMSRKGRESGVQ